MFYFLYGLATTLKPNTGGGYGGSGRVGSVPTLPEASDNILIATTPERIVLAWLDRKGIIYDFQSSMMGGRYELGGSIVDVLIPDLNTAIRIQGGYWHQGVEKSATDTIQRELLESHGWQVVDVWEKDLTPPERANYTLEAALRGQEVV